MECDAEWEKAKTVASDAKKELDAASSAISLFIDRVDRQRSGVAAGQPKLRVADAGGAAH